MHILDQWRTIYCLDLATGAVRWQGGEHGDAGSCLATADDRLIVWSGRGKLALVESARRSPKEYRELAARDGLGANDVWPHVVLADGRLLLRDREGNLACFEVRQ